MPPKAGDEGFGGEELRAGAVFPLAESPVGGDDGVAPGHVASGAEAIAILPLIAICAYMIISAKRK